MFEKSGKTVPVFCDKHLSYDRKKAADMVATAKKMDFPMMAGSSLPVTWRRPELEFKLGTKITEALVASRGELEIYGIHALEALQCMVERRYSNADPKPANQGVKAVTALQGDAVWKAGEAGLSLKGSVVCSDAFFPFPDGLIAAAEAGATAAIQPGGSVRDKEVIAAANERKIAMMFTGVRHFRH